MNRNQKFLIGCILLITIGLVLYFKLENKTVENEDISESYQPNALEIVQDKIRSEGLGFFEQTYKKPQITDIRKISEEDSTSNKLDDHEIEYKNVWMDDDYWGIGYYVNNKEIYSNDRERFDTISRISTVKGDFDMVINSSMGSCGCGNIVFLYSYLGKIKMSDYFKQDYENFEEGEEDFAKNILEHNVLVNDVGHILLSRLDSPLFDFMGSNPSIQTVRIPILVYLNLETGEIAKYKGSAQENEATTKMYLRLSQEMEDAINEYDKSLDKYIAKEKYQDFPNILGFKYQLDRMAGYSKEKSIENLSEDYKKLTVGFDSNVTVVALDEIISETH